MKQNTYRTLCHLTIGWPDVTGFQTEDTVPGPRLSPVLSPECKADPGRCSFPWAGAALAVPALCTCVMCSNTRGGAGEAPAATPPPHLSAKLEPPGAVLGTHDHPLPRSRPSLLPLLPPPITLSSAAVHRDRTEHSVPPFHLPTGWCTGKNYAKCSPEGRDCIEN